MFAQSMKMRGIVQLKMDHTLSFRSKLYDGTPFELDVTKHDVQLNEPFKPSKLFVEGFLYVVKESQQGDRCYLTLPKPTIQFGRQITVSEFDLMPPGVTVEDFIAKKGTKVPVSKDATPEEIQAKVMGTSKEENKLTKKARNTKKSSVTKSAAKKSAKPKKKKTA